MCESVSVCVYVCVWWGGRSEYFIALHCHLPWSALSFSSNYSPLPSNLFASLHTPLVLRGKKDQNQKQKSRASFSSLLCCLSPPVSVSPLPLRLAGPEAAEVRGKHGPFREPRAPRGPQTPARAGGTVATAASGTLPSYRNPRR